MNSRDMLYWEGGKGIEHEWITQYIENVGHALLHMLRYKFILVHFTLFTSYIWLIIHIYIYIEYYILKMLKYKII